MNSHNQLIIVQDQNIIEYIATKIVDNIMNLFAKHIIEESTQE